jgi:hypothetical protein
MSVGVERDGDARLTEHLAHYLGVNDLGEQERRAGMPAAMASAIS